MLGAVNTVLPLTTQITFLSLCGYRYCQRELSRPGHRDQRCPTQRERSCRVGPRGFQIKEPDHFYQILIQEELVELNLFCPSSNSPIAVYPLTLCLQLCTDFSVCLFERPSLSLSVSLFISLNLIPFLLRLYHFLCFIHQSHCLSSHLSFHVQKWRETEGNTML